MIRTAAVASLLAALLLAGCASQQSVTLLPRGQGTQGSGTLDRMNNELIVSIDGNQYRGPMIVQTSQSAGYGLFGAPRTTVSNQATALLLGAAGGQIRCEFGFDAMWTMATGVCIDSKNVTYDMLIKN